MRIGVEVGRPFTDLVAIGRDDIRVLKVPSTPRRPDEGAFAALIASEISLDTIDDLAHGSTVATNAVSKHKGFASGQYGNERKSDLACVGRSMIPDPWGVIIATASDDEGVVTAYLDLDLIEVVRNRYPLLRQRRPDLYETLPGQA